MINPISTLLITFYHYKLTNYGIIDKFQIAQRIAKELKDGYYVNPWYRYSTLVAYISSGTECCSSK